MENCAHEIQNTDGANCCVVIPNLIKGMLYTEPAKLIVNDGQESFEPSGLTYTWEIDVKGIIIVSGVNEQIAMFDFNDTIVSGL